MKISFKIISIVFLVLFILLAIDTYLSLQREKKLFDYDMQHDALVLGNTIKDMVAEVWVRNGKKQALQLIRDFNKQKYVKLRWVELDANLDETYIPIISQENIIRIKSGEPISIKTIRKDNIKVLRTYIPMQVENRIRGALEVSESLTQRNSYIHESMLRSVILIGIILLVSIFILWIVGTKFIGKPLQQLVEKTRLIGESDDFSSGLIVYGHDELSELTIAMNRMCEQLAEASEAVRQETEKRIAAIEQLRHAERLATLGRLSSGIAHELGTPLNVVSGRAKMIATMDLNNEEIIEFATIIKQQSERMTKIIRQLLDFARRRVAQRSSINIVNLTQQVMEMLNQIAKKNNVNFKLVEDIDLPQVSVDQAQIEQVLMNLMMNGIQAMTGGGTLEIKFNIEHTSLPANKNDVTKDYLTICVKDDGEGISEENQKQIFEPFFTTKGTGKGTGLGLSITHGIVEEHGGWIKVESEIGKGSCFTIYLPLE